jgi:DNA-binding transcriptional LysR family regulator
MNVSLRLLRAFLAVAGEGNVGRAAAKMFVSQPALSQDVRRLERTVGTELFERGAYGVRLTPAGEVLFRDVEAALSLLDRGVERARAAAHSERRKVILSFTPSIGHRLIPALLPALEDKLPGVTVDEREVDTGDVVPGVLAGRFDLGLVHCAPEDPRLHPTPLGHDPLCVAISSLQPLARSGSPVSLRALDGLSLLLWPREVATGYYDHLLAMCTGAGLRPAVVPGPRRTLIRSYVLAEGDVFCLLPSAVAGLNVPGVTFLPVRDEAATVPLTMVRRIDDERPEVLATEAQAADEIIGSGTRHEVRL